MSATIGRSRSAYDEQLLDDLVDRRSRGGCRPWRAAGSSARARPRPSARRIFSSKRSWTRMPTRFILSAYVGPMPRPVVPILRAAEEALGHLVDGAVVRRDDVRVGADDAAARCRRRAPRARRSPRRAPPRSTTTPLPMTGRAAGREDAGGQQVQGVLLVVDDDGVAGVVAAVELDDVVDAAARAGRSPCPCPRRPTGRRRARSPASRLLSPVRRAEVPRRAEGPSRVRAGASYTPPYRGMPCASGSAQRRRRASAQPSWNRVSTPLTAIRCATRRRTVRRLTPR